MSFAYITEEGAYIKKRGGVFVVGRNQEVVMEIPEETLEGLTLIDGVQVSSRFRAAGRFSAVWSRRGTCMFSARQSRSS